MSWTTPLVRNDSIERYHRDIEGRPTVEVQVAVGAEDVLAPVAAVHRSMHRAGEGEPIIAEEMQRLCRKRDDLLSRGKHDPAKVLLAVRLRRETTRSVKDSPEHLHLVTPLQRSGEILCSFVFSHPNSPCEICNHSRGTPCQRITKIPCHWGGARLRASPVILAGGVTVTVLVQRETPHGSKSLSTFCH